MLGFDNKLVVDTVIASVVDVSLGVDNEVVFFSIDVSVVVKERLIGLVTVFEIIVDKLLLSVEVKLFEVTVVFVEEME